MNIILSFVGFAVLAFSLYTLCTYCIGNGWAYYFFDLVIKAFTGIAAVLMAGGVYWKWNDEKKRKLYEDRIQKVYAPLIKVLIYQETYREILNTVDGLDIGREKYPIFGDSKRVQYYKQTNEGKKVFDYIGESEEKIYMRRTDFFKAIENTSVGLARPTLLSLISRYTLLLQYKEDCWAELHDKYPDIDSEVKSPERTEEIETADIYLRCKKIDSQVRSVETGLCEEIVDGYNDSLKKLGLDTETIDLNSPKFVK